jgi:hypothetical protein
MHDLYTNPDLIVQTAACVRSFTPSFRRTFWTCFFVVVTLIAIDRAI